MLNKNNERELCYVTLIDNILPINGADRVEQAVVGGWRIMTRKGQFHPGDPAIYFEIDSKVPEIEAFEFLAPKHYKVKTQKYFKGTVISQGLLMHAEDFGWIIGREGENSRPFIVDDKNQKYYADDESRFLTKKLNVIYAEAADNARKARSDDKYKRMAQRHGKLFSHQPFRWMMKHTWGKKILFLFFGKKKDKRGWPEWVAKTDEERVENMPWVLENKDPWIATEKIDGTSTTFTYKKGFKNEFYVCSRNVVFDKPDKQCFYESNVYIEMAEKYNMENILKTLLKERFPHASWITIQGETYGEGIQKRDYSMKGHDLMVFNLIVSDRGRINSFTMKEILEKEYNIPCVPILDLHYILPDTIEELRAYVDSQPSTIDGKMKEGIVFRSQDGSKSFKCVSPSYLLKFHQ